MTRHRAHRPSRRSRIALPLSAATLAIAVLAGTHAVADDAAHVEQSGASSLAADGGQLSEAASSAQRRARAAERAARHAGHGRPPAASSTPSTSTREPAAGTATGSGGTVADEGTPSAAPSTTTPAPAAPTPATVAAPAPGGLGPRAVDLSPQGATRIATNTPAGIVTAINTAPAGSTVLIPGGSYGALAVNRQVSGGTVRVLPAPGATVTIASVNLTGASGLDWRGINTTAGVRFQNTTGVQWRGGTHTLTSADTGFLIHAGSRDITVEDVTVRGADCSFYLQASDEASRPTGILLQRFRSEDVHQDHVFISRGSATIQDFVMHGHTEDAEHQDGVQIVGGKDVTVRRGSISNDRAFRDRAIDRNDHGVMINYTPGEGRVPERITLEDLDIHDMTSTGVAVAGVRGLILRRVHAHDNGPGGQENDLVIDPDRGNVITGLVEVGNTFPKRVVS